MNINSRLSKPFKTIARLKGARFAKRELSEAERLAHKEGQRISNHENLAACCAWGKGKPFEFWSRLHKRTPWRFSHQMGKGWE